MKYNFRHKICSGWKKYYIISIPTFKNITIFIPYGINNMEYLFATEKNIKDYYTSCKFL